MAHGMVLAKGQWEAMLGDPYMGLCICFPIYMLVHECTHVLLAGIQLWPKLWSWGPGASPGTVVGVSQTTSWVPGMTSRSSSSPWEGQAVTPEGLGPIPLPTTIPASPYLPLLPAQNLTLFP
jgi:hypothetical protein